MDNIIIERIWQDDSFFEIRVKAISALIESSIDLYVTESDMIALSNAFSSFWPSNTDSECYWDVFEINAGKSLSFHILPEDTLGHLLIQVYMLIKDGDPNHWNPEHRCCFYIRTDIGLINTFGKRLLSINKPNLGAKIALVDC